MKSVSISRIFIILIMSLGISNVALAWDASGHRLIAEIAYQSVRPDVKKNLTQLTHVLNKHYRQERFSMTASWMDEIKSFHDVKAFSHWHYINLPYGNIHPVEPDKENIVWALQESKTVLKSHRSNAFEKSFFLRFFIHFVGDIHQPLHCISFYSSQFPEGDAGGTLYKLDDPRYDNLHRFWDAAGGVFDIDDEHHAGEHRAAAHYAFEHHALRHKALSTTAASLMARYPQSQYKKELQVTDFKQWSIESFTLAQRVTHTVGNGEKISPQYRSMTQDIAQRQIVLAGYRLAQQLNEIFKDKEG